MLHRRLIHSASRQIVPSDRVYSPSRNEYAPKWMNMPNRLSRHQAVRAEVNASSTAEFVPGPAASAGPAVAMSAETAAATGTISPSVASSATSTLLRRRVLVMASTAFPCGGLEGMRLAGRFQAIRMSDQRWLAEPLQVFWTMGVPLVVEAPLTSRHFPLWTAVSVHVLPAPAVSRHCWFGRPVEVHWITWAPSTVDAPETSALRLLFALARKYVWPLRGSGWLTAVSQVSWASAQSPWSLPGPSPASPTTRSTCRAPVTSAVSACAGEVPVSVPVRATSMPSASTAKVAEPEPAVSSSMPTVALKVVQCPPV